MVPVHSYAADILNLITTEDTARTCDIFKEILTSGSDAAWQIVEEFILKDPELSRDSDLIESYRNRKMLTEYGDKVRNRVAKALYERSFRVDKTMKGQK